MLYNLDPILPFEYADKLEQGLPSNEEENYQGDMESDAGSKVLGTTTDPLLSQIEFRKSAQANLHKDKQIK